MSRFDLSNTADFSRITQQSLGDVIRLVDGRDPSQWDLLEGTYNGVIFHVFQSKVNWQGAVARMSDTTGRRKVKYQFPYKDGQTTDDLGRKAESFSVEVLIHGIRYMQGFVALMNELNKPTPGTLTHPIRGQITVVPEDVQIAYSSDQRKAVLLNIVFIEHNFTVGNLRDIQDPSVKGKLAEALELFKKVDDTIKTVEAAQFFVRGVKNRIKSLLEIFKKDSGVMLTAMNVTFNLGAGSADIPTLLPVNEGGLRKSDGTVTDENFLVVRSVSDPFNNIPVDVTSEETIQAVAALQLQKQMLDLRTQVSVIINEINTNGGALDMFDDIIGLRESVILLQAVFEAGVASSNVQMIDYEVPRLMSAREVAFANGIDPERANEIDLLNPFLLSVNYIEKGTVLKVPVS